MKNIILTIIGSLLLPYQAYSQSTDPAIPVGTLNVNMGMVRQGVAPTLGWSIEYPNEIDDIIDIDPNDEIETKTRLRVPSLCHWCGYHRPIWQRIPCTVLHTLLFARLETRIHRHRISS